MRLLTSVGRPTKYILLFWSMWIPARLHAQVTSARIEGMELDSKELLDRLDRPFWQALAETKCRLPSPQNPPSWQIGSRANAIRSYLVAITEISGTRAGSVIDRSTVFQNDQYKVERIAVLQRLPGAVSFAFVVHPVGMLRKSPAVVLLHGSGMYPQEALGWTLVNAYRKGERAGKSAFIGLASELADAGYTVYIPWLADDGLSAFWPQFHWSGLERNGAALGARVPWLGPMHFVVNEILGGADYLGTLPEVDTTRMAVVGWAEGAQLAGVVASLDTRFHALVKLAPPVDRSALRGTIPGLFDGAHFSHVDCLFGDAEIATLVAPRPLLYAYSTNDESVSRIAGFISPSVVSRIKQLYQTALAAASFAVIADSSWGPKNSRDVRFWIDRSLQFSPRPVAPTKTSEPAGPQMEYRTPWIDTTRAHRERYVSALGTCVTQWPHPDFSSVATYLASVEPFRQKIARDLGLGAPKVGGRVTVLRRSLVAKMHGYTLEFVDLRSDRTAMSISGLLATPDIKSEPGASAFVSADGNAGVGTQFGLLGRERTPYLNAYADALAASGTVVFVPYYPFQFPEVAAAEAGARPGSDITSFSYTIPIFSASFDFLATIQGVDPTRIGIWGVSFGGVAALYTAALDTRFSTVVFSDPIVSADVLFATQTSASLVSWWPEVCGTVDAVQAYLIAPRRFIRENGLRDANGFERAPLESIDKIRQTYDLLGYGPRFELVRHTGGHETRPVEVRRALELLGP